MADIMDVLRGISQAVSHAHDGSHDERTLVGGEAKTAGLKRERGDLNLEARVMDGFKVRVSGPILMVTYHSEINLKEVHNANKFESDCEQHIADIIKYLKKEYKKITGNSLGLSKVGESDIKVEYMNNIRCWVIATCNYKIAGLDGVEEIEAPSKDRLDKAFKDWISLGKNDRLI